jgi:hypothetical protein
MIAIFAILLCSLRCLPELCSAMHIIMLYVEAFKWKLQQCTTVISVSRQSLPGRLIILLFLIKA